MKKKIFIIGIISLIIILVGVICYNNDSIRFKISYEYINLVEYNNGKTIKVDIPLNNKIKYLENKEIIEFLENGTGIVYFGYNTCPWCRNIIEPLIEVANEEKINTIYYVNSKENLSNIKKDLYEILDKYLRTDPDTLKKRLAVPDVYFIKDGKIMFHHIGSVDSYSNPYKEMNGKQKKELKEIYRNGIEAIK